MGAPVNGAGHVEAPGRMRRAAFLDRDGVINVDTGYLFRADELRFTPTAIEGIRLLNEAGYLVIVVTNQSGIARGFYREEDVDALHMHIQDRLAAGGAHIDAFYYCGYHPDGTIERFARNHEDRKPGAGMLLRAMTEWSIGRDGSFMIGDKASDMEAAHRAGIRGILVDPDTCDLVATAAAALSHAGGADRNAVIRGPAEIGQCTVPGL